MKTGRLVSILLSAIIIFSCKSGDSGTDNDGNGDNNQPYTEIKTVTITSAGGVIETNDISLKIPAGGVAGSANLKLSAAQNQLDAPMAVSKFYKLESNTDVSLSYLKVKYSGTLAGQNYIAWQEDSYIQSAGKMASARFFVPAVDSSGYLVARLADIGPGVGKKTEGNNSPKTGLFYALTGQMVYNPGNHFKIIYPTGSAAHASNLAAYLETAYTLLQGYGFNYLGRDWPAEVYLQKFDGWLNGTLGLDNNAYGYYMTSTKNPMYLGWRTNNCAMYFNLNKAGDANEMSATAGHEFFHAVQDLYDPRGPVEKKWNASPQAWLDEACAVWFEGKMNTSASYPVSLSGNELAFTEGMHVTGANAQNHGYGMAPIIKYIVQQKGTSALESIYRKINLGAHPVEALFSTVNPDGSTYNTDWFNNFLKSYVPGGIYNIPAITIGQVPSNRRYESKLITDTLSSFPSVTYPDFSGQFYYVSLTYPDIQQKSVNVNFKTNSSTSKIHIFKYENSANTLLKSGGTSGELSLTPAEIKNALGGGNRLYMLVLVTNNEYHSGFQGSKDISLTVKINYNAGPAITLQPSYWEGGVNEGKIFSIVASNLPQRYRYDWRWGDGSSESTTQPGAAHSYSSAGVYTINVDLFDLDLNQITATTSGTAKVATNPASINPPGSEGLINTAYQWNVITDYNLANARYEWDFGDGSAKETIFNNKTASHSYTTQGTYTIKVDIFDNSTGLKLESPSTTFKVYEMPPLLAEIRAATGFTLNASLFFGNGSEDTGAIIYYFSIIKDFNIPNVTVRNISWTGLTTFSGTAETWSGGVGGSTKSTITCTGSVSLDGQKVSFTWIDTEIGTGENSWYFHEDKVVVTNMQITQQGGQTYAARYKIQNSTDFLGHYKATTIIEPHTLKVYSIPRPSMIEFEFSK